MLISVPFFSPAAPETEKHGKLYHSALLHDIINKIQNPGHSRAILTERPGQSLCRSGTDTGEGAPFKNHTGKENCHARRIYSKRYSNAG